MQKKNVAATNKVAAKKVVKKVIAKKVSGPTKKALVYTDNDHSFWVKDGQILNSLVSLSKALEKMDKAVFAHHVSDKKHDFASWVDSALCDSKCAMDLRKTRNVASARKTVARHLSNYKI